MLSAAVRCFLLSDATATRSVVCLGIRVVRELCLLSGAGQLAKIWLWIPNNFAKQLSL